ncbi:MAG: O-methyltransferase [Geminicoccaceae bacterium]|nr:O-methyltransferase [Geminicoccaceae bacterium]MCB9945196.1 O-methyltransferase [Geminicoccaceae bacterium]
MSPRGLALDDRLQDYLIEAGMREHPELCALRLETAGMAHGGMQSSPEQMQLIGLMLRMIGARKVLEIGCFTGYGTLAMALALPGDGRVITLDVNDDWAQVGRRHWRAAGVEDRIDMRTGLAQESLEGIDEDASFDLVYIDADKKSYGIYLDHALRLVRPGGIIALDNMLWHGAVADPGDHSHQVESLRQTQARIMADSTLSATLVPIGDGVTIAWKRR